MNAGAGFCHTTFLAKDSQKHGGGSNARNDRVVGEELLKHTDAICPAHLHFKTHEALTDPHQGVDINGFVNLQLLGSDPVVLVLRRVHLNQAIVPIT